MPRHIGGKSMLFFNTIYLNVTTASFFSFWATGHAFHSNFALRAHNRSNRCRGIKETASRIRPVWMRLAVDYHLVSTIQHAMDSGRLRRRALKAIHTCRKRVLDQEEGWPIKERSFFKKNKVHHSVKSTTHYYDASCKIIRTKNCNGQESKVCCFDNGMKILFSCLKKSFFLLITIYK